MSLDAELDSLIQRVRRAEAPAAHAREHVRCRIERQLASGASDPAFEQAVLQAPVRSLPRALTWGAPLLAAIGAAALIVLRLAPQTTDPLLRAPEPAAGLTAQQSSATVAVEPSAAVAEPVGADEPGVILADPAAPAPAAKEPAAAKPATAAKPAAGANIAPQRAPSGAESSPRLLEESLALAEVQRALRDKEFARALDLLVEQEQRFAGGALHQERSVARAVAACGLGVPAPGVRELAKSVPPLYAARLRSACPDVFAAEAGERSR